jgi:hypothetical protein
MTSDRALTASPPSIGWPSRIRRAWRALPSERRLAAISAVCLVFTLFLPWYQETVVARTLKTGSATLTGWGAFSWVEAAVLLVAAGVLTLLFQRAEGRAFHVPGGDGGVIGAAGAWACLLIVWRMFDKQGVSSHSLYAATSGVEWGIFIALAVAATLIYAGMRIRAAHRPEPPLPGEAPRPRTAQQHSAPRPSAPRRRVADPKTPLGRLFAERPAWSGAPVGPFEPPTRGVLAPHQPAPPPEPSPSPSPRLEEDQLTIPLDEPE